MENKKRQHWKDCDKDECINCYKDTINNLWDTIDVLCKYIKNRK